MHITQKNIPNKKTVRSFKLLLFGTAYLITFPVQAQEWLYTVHSGDNLWNISEKYLKKGFLYTSRLQALNSIQNPKRLPPGSKIKIPIKWLKYQPVPALVHSIQGRCTHTTATSNKADLTVNTQLFTGETLECSKNSNMTLKFADGSKLLVQENSLLKLDVISEYPNTGMVDTRVRLQNGNIDTQVENKKGPGSRYEIITPSAVAAVRGTDFRIHAGTQGDQVQGEVLEGRINVAARGVKRSVKQGFGVTVKQGKAPSKPKKLLPAPLTTELNKTQRYLPLVFQWPDVEGAVKYRLQVAENRQFDTLLADKVAEQSELKVADLPEGNYILRLRAIDDSDLEGWNALFDFTVDARPEPPMPLSPKDGATLYTPKPKFWWSKPAGTVAYHFELASDTNFDTLIDELARVEDSQIILDKELSPGTYYWRLSSYAESGEEGPVSLPTQHFVVKEKPAAPEAEQPGMDELSINFRWKEDPEASHYLFELSESDDFSEILIGKVVEQPSLSIPFAEIEPDTYYFRIKTVNKDGIEGPFSTTQELEIPTDNSAYWTLLLLLFLIPALI